MTGEYVRGLGICGAVWLVGAVAVLVLAGGRALETYFFVGFVGLLVAMQILAPADGQPGWWRMLRGVELACFLVFLYVISGRILLIL